MQAEDEIAAMCSAIGIQVIDFAIQIHGGAGLSGDFNPLHTDEEAATSLGQLVDSLASRR